MQSAPGCSALPLSDSGAAAAARPCPRSCFSKRQSISSHSGAAQALQLGDQVRQFGGVRGEGQHVEQAAQLLRRQRGVQRDNVARGAFAQRRQQEAVFARQMVDASRERGLDLVDHVGRGRSLP